MRGSTADLSPPTLTQSTELKIGAIDQHVRPNVEVQHKSPIGNLLACTSHRSLSSFAARIHWITAFGRTHSTSGALAAAPTPPDLVPRPSKKKTTHCKHGYQRQCMLLQWRKKQWRERWRPWRLLSEPKGPWQVSCKDAGPISTCSPAFHQGGMFKNSISFSTGKSIPSADRA